MTYFPSFSKFTETILHYLMAESISRLDRIPLSALELTPALSKIVSLLIIDDCFLKDVSF